MASVPPPSGRVDRPILDLARGDRDRAVPALRESFTGIYRWHAKRTLRDIGTVRAIEIDGEIAAVAMLEQFDADVAYVYYLFVGARWRRQGLAGRLLDDALHRFRAAGARVAYAACEEENVASRRLFASRGFREVSSEEPNWRDGGLGARGYRSRMWVVRGEVLLGRWLSPDGTPIVASIPPRGGMDRNEVRRTPGSTEAA